MKLCLNHAKISLPPSPNPSRFSIFRREGVETEPLSCFQAIRLSASCPWVEPERELSLIWIKPEREITIFGFDGTRERELSLIWVKPERESYLKPENELSNIFCIMPSLIQLFPEIVNMSVKCRSEKLTQMKHVSFLHLFFYVLCQIYCKTIASFSFCEVFSHSTLPRGQVALKILTSKTQVVQ